MFIGRQAELEFLSDKYTSDSGQLIILYGRRRIGKTELLREFCKDKPHIFFSCVQTTASIQLQNFSSRLLGEGLPASKYISTFDKWEDAFGAILELPYKDKKKLLVIDEFPYMCRADRSIPSILQNLWDTRLRDENVMIILCGSSMSFVEKELLAEKNPLYGRATGIYKMTEMNFYDAIRFFDGYSSRDKIYAYAILGGVPHYLRQFNPSLSIENNIKKNILTRGAILYSEVEFLLHQELRETSIYSSIIEAVALGNTKLNDICQKSLVEGTSKTSVYLKNMIELGLVEHVFSVDARIKEMANTSRGIYQLTDSFFRFWYTFCFGNYSELEDGDVDGFYEHVVEPRLHEFVAHAFEYVCRQFVRKLRSQRRLPFYYTNMGQWFGNTTVRDGSHGTRMANTEIDILCLDQSRENILVGECKFKKNPFSYSEYLDLTAKLEPLKAHAKFYYALFSENGFDKRILELSERGDVALYGLDDIVECKTQG
jgi:uncharacterized protein